MSKTYTYPKSGKKVKVEKVVYYETVGKNNGKVTRRYALLGKDEEGKTKFVIQGKAAAEKFGKPVKHVKSEAAKTRKPRKSCQEKFDECEAKKSAKKGKKKVVAKEESEEQEESEEKEESEEEVLSEEESPKKKSSSPKKKSAKGKSAKGKAKGKGKK